MDTARSIRMERSEEQPNPSTENKHTTRTFTRSFSLRSAAAGFPCAQSIPIQTQSTLLLRTQSSLLPSNPHAFDTLSPKRETQENREGKEDLEKNIMNGMHDTPERRRQHASTRSKAMLKLECEKTLSKMKGEETS